MSPDGLFLRLREEGRERRSILDARGHAGCIGSRDLTNLTSRSEAREAAHVRAGQHEPPD